MNVDIEKRETIVNSSFLNPHAIRTEEVKVDGSPNRNRDKQWSTQLGVGRIFLGRARE